MRLSFFKNTVLILAFFCFSCGSQGKDKNDSTSEETLLPSEGGLVIHDTYQIKEKREEKKEIIVGANQISEYFPLLKDKKVGIVANQTSIVRWLEDHREDRGSSSHVSNQDHLVDFLIMNKISVKKVFAPEHGFRGKADAGEAVKDGVDTKTGLPIISLYGKNKKPTPQQLEGIEVMVFDIQDVGVRFYTYIATLHHVMEACAEAGIPLIILDRPNPNGHYIDGPMMETGHTSFLGMHSVPLVHGMTIGEYAQMINGEGWLADGIKCRIEVITLKNYTHQSQYSLPVRPSPNLPNDIAINLYPSLGLLEGTNLNAGRGTEMQFQLIGSPFLPKEIYPFSYTPQPNFGAKYPKHNGIACNGLDLRDTPRMSRIDLTWIIEAYQSHQQKNKFFNTANFTAHAGTARLQRQIEQGFTFREIRKTWLRDLEGYDKMRQKYLLYK